MNKFFDQISAQLKIKNILYLKVKILAQMPLNQIIDQLEDGTYKIKVVAPPRQGGANKELCRFLKKKLEAKEVVVLTGSREKVKLIRISL